MTKFWLFVLAIICPLQLTAATYYVKTTGDDGTGDGSEGTPWATPGYAAQQMGDGDVCYVQSGTYTITTVTPGAAGPILFGTANVRCLMEGYATTAGDRCAGGSLPLIQASASLNPAGTVYLIQLDGTTNEPQIVSYLRVDCNDEPNTTGIKGDQYYLDRAVGCHTENAAVNGYQSLTAYRCLAANNGSRGYQYCNAHFCAASGNVADGFYGAYIVSDSYAADNGAQGFDGFNCVFVRCTSHSNDSHGFDFPRNNVAIQCVSDSDGGYAFNTTDHAIVIRSAHYNPTSGRTNTTPMQDYGAITLTAAPFVDAANYDFTPNSTAGGGALLRAAGWSVWGHSGYDDVGAVQHQDSGGGGGLFDPIVIPD